MGRRDRKSEVGFEGPLSTALEHEKKRGDARTSSVDIDVRS